MTIGITSLGAEAYHADGVDERPSLSASIAHILCTQSPAHARAAHPKLNPSFEREDEDRFDIGTVAHALLLEGSVDGVVVIDAPDWRKKEVKELREAARAEGKIALLEKHYGAVQAMVVSAWEQLEALEIDPPLFRDGKPEQTIVWEEGSTAGTLIDPVVCRARIDWLHDDYFAIDDLKTSARSASPEAFSRRLFDMGADVQAAMYIRGVEKLTGIRPIFRWCVIETAPPYLLSVVSPGPAMLALAEAKVAWAINQWRTCLAAKHWPGYEGRVAYADLPPYEEMRWLDKMAREEQVA